MARFPIEGITELTKDDLEAMLNPVEDSEKYGFVPSKLELKPGVRMIPAFDTHYFEPGSIVATYLIDDEGELYRERLALICGYEDGLQTMKLNEPWPSNECRQYEVSLDDYLNGRVMIKRLVKEDSK